MLSRLGRRLLELVVTLFAVLGFLYVPLGKKTGFEHVKAIVMTPPAKEAGRELFDVGSKLRSRVVDSVTGQSEHDAGTSESLMCVEPVVASISSAADASVPNALQ